MSDTATTEPVAQNKKSSKLTLQKVDSQLLGLARYCTQHKTDEIPLAVFFKSQKSYNTFYNETKNKYGFSFLKELTEGKKKTIFCFLFSF